MARKNENLNQTRGKFEFVGIVAGMTRDKAYTEGVGKNSNKPWHKLRFNVKTSKNNAPTVELMASQVDTFKITNSKNKDDKKDHPFLKRKSIPDGWYMSKGTTLLITKDAETSKLVQERIHAFDAVSRLYEVLKDGDSVKVTGNIKYQEYEDKNKKMQRQVTYEIDYITLTKEPVDFEAEGFEETAYFHQEIVYDQSAKIDDKLFVDGIVIAFDKTYAPAQFTIDATTHAKLANNVGSRLKFGDVIPVYGRVISGAVVVENAANAQADDDDWGSDENPIGNATEWINEMRIIGVESKDLDSGVYTEADFAPSEEEENFGGSGGNKNDDDWGNEGQPIDISDDDLPF